MTQANEAAHEICRAPSKDKLRAGWRAHLFDPVKIARVYGEGSMSPSANSVDLWRRTPGWDHRLGQSTRWRRYGQVDCFRFGDNPIGVKGDFHCQPPPKISYTKMPSFFTRYQAGEYVAVWNELMALGQGVRDKKHYADAVAVGAETMRRARHNVELLIQRLAQMGYRFVAPSLEDELEEWRLAMNPRSSGRVAGAVWAGLSGSTKDNKARREKLGKARAQMERIVIARCAALEAKMAAASKKSPLKNPDVFDPPRRQVAAQLSKLEKLTGGSMPISLRAWYEQVGAVSLIGAHEVLNPRGCEIADPLVVYPLDRKLSEGEFEDVADDGGRLEYYIAASDRAKANMLGGNFYSIIIPNGAADAPLENEWHQTTFVNYLRRTFEWGGFPGWARDTNPPRDLIAKLTEGLLSL